MRKKYIEAEITIENIEFPNKGIGYFDGNKITVKNTIPEQKVNVQIKRKKRKYEGRLIGILQKASYEVEAYCDMFGICGGCTYQHIEYKKEIEFKQKMLLEILEKGNIRGFEFLGLSHSPQINEYRNKMEFSFGDTQKDGQLELGMRKRNSFYEVASASNCKIVSEDIRKVLRCTLDYFKQSGEKFYHKMKKTGSLRHLLVRQAYFTKEILVNIVTTSAINTNLESLKSNLLKLQLDGNIKGILHIVNNSIADIVKADEINILYGNDYFYEKLLGLTFKISVFSFFQTNSLGAEKLYNIVKKFVGDTKNQVVFDLYCGTGTIAQIVASNAKKVIGIEIVEDAIKSAKENAKLNNIGNCEFIAGDVYKVVAELKQTPDLIILDPPREGIHPKAIHKIIDFEAKKVVYISCKVSSLVKDLTVFVENGYTVDKIQGMDMFARTPHVESVVLMTRVER